MKTDAQIIVCGGRDFSDTSLMESALNEIIERYDKVEIISGHAKGADQLGENYSKMHPRKTVLKLFPADWKNKGKTAGIIRNQEMLDYIKTQSNPMVVAFWDGQSRGTKHMINISEDAGVPVSIYSYGESSDSSSSSASSESANDVERPRKSVMDIVTERFTEQLKKGVIPWQKPWVSLEGEYVGAWGHGENAKPYSLLNQMVLPKEGEYITMKQIQREGGTLKKGSKGYQIFFYDSFTTTQRNSETNVDEEVNIPFLKYYTVFHISDTDVEPTHKTDESVLKDMKSPRRNSKADKLLKDYIKKTGIEYEEVLRDRACYKMIADKIELPDAKQFKKTSGYYGTVFHEVVHSTGHKDRLNRFSKKNVFKGKEYSLEELVAEIGSYSILYRLGLDTKEQFNNSASYISGWLNALENDHRMIVTASTKAQKAVRYIYEQ